MKVGELLDRAELKGTVIAGRSGLTRTITVPRIQKPGLALTGWPEQLHDGRVLVIGGTEIEYLTDHEVARTQGIATLMASDPACVVVCRGCEAPVELREACEARGVSLILSELVTADFIAAVTMFMTDKLAPATEVHGVLVDVIGVGVLVTGKSGIGKSETALDLVQRGHRLVADDVIAIQRRGTHVVGKAAGMLGHHMEIRGLGIINVRDLFGIAAVRETKRIELMIELRDWEASEEYDRLGFDDHHHEILGVQVAALRVPVRPGRNVATIVEVAARNQLLKIQGTYSALAFRETLDRAMNRPMSGPVPEPSTDEERS